MEITDYDNTRMLSLLRLSSAKKEYDCCCETVLSESPPSTAAELPREQDACAYGDGCEPPAQESAADVVTPPRTYGLKAMLTSTRRQVNEYVDRMNWKSVSMSDQCGFVHLLLMLFAIYATVVRRACAPFTAVPTAVGIVLRFVQFLTGRLLDVADTRNGPDRATKAAVLCAQCTVLVTFAGLFVLVYAPVVRLAVKLFVITMNAPLLVSSMFY